MNALDADDDMPEAPIAESRRESRRESAPKI
jgi:hypothetical protein